MERFLTVIVLLFFEYGMGQVRMPPPPPCYANDNTGVGGVVGNGHFLHSYYDDRIVFHFSAPGTAGFNDILVLYIATNAPGRNIIDASVDDAASAHRIAITNSDINGFASDVVFPVGFEASFAIAVDVNSGELYQIPNSGNVGHNGLIHLSSVNSTLTSSTQGFFDITLYFSDIGIMADDGFYFVATYVSSDGYSYDEGYGDGILPGTIGGDTIQFTSSRYVYDNPGCQVTLNVNENDINPIGVKYLNDQLWVKGITGETSIEVFDVLGRKEISVLENLQGDSKIPMKLSEFQINFVVIKNKNKRKTFKILPH